MFDLVFLSGVRAGAVVQVTESMVAGRSPDCDIEVPDPNASRAHIRFEWDGAQLFVVDNGSSNGSYVNERRVESQLLRHGDVVRLGETRLRVQRRAASRSGRVELSSSAFGLSHSASDSVDSALSLSLQDAIGSGSSIEGLRARLDAMMWVSETLAQETDLEQIYHHLIEALFRVFPQAERGFLLLGDEPESLDPKAMRTRKRGATTGLTVSASLCTAALTRRAVMLYTEDDQAEFDQGVSLLDLRIRSAMAIPLMVKDEILGLTIIDTQDSHKPFTEEDMGVAAAVCRQGAVALKNALLLGQVEREVKVRSNLLRFLPRQVVDQAVAGEIDLALGGSTCRGTIFFCDIIGFTGISEALNPQDVVSLINDLFNLVCPIIEQEEGAIDKFMGDAIMALWGVPFDTELASLSAVTAGMRIQTGLISFNHNRPDSRPVVNMGIGMSWGPMVAGNVGSQDRVEYTVLGNTVNTASRIEQLAAGDQILVSAELFERQKSKLYAIQLPEVFVKNKDAAVSVYSVRGIVMNNGEITLHIPIYIGGYRAWIIRRLLDDTFICIHEEGINFDQSTAVTNTTELSSCQLGLVKVVALLPKQESDGGLRRSLITFDDPSLSGIISDLPKNCDLSWNEMNRSVQS